MHGSTDPHQAGAAISEGIGRVVAEFIGRGPTNIRTTVVGDLVVCVMRDTFTKAERTLVERDQGAFVKDMRLRFQETMAQELTDVVVKITGREVEAFLSDHSVVPDIAVETFILRPER